MNDMDMSPTIIPRSDQLNADDLIAGPITVTIRDVKINPGAEQPVNIALEGTDKFFRPCKSSCRVLVQAWGADAKAYIGRSLTLYRDPTVKWGGLEIGGIRISHMSDIDGVKQMMLTATKGSRKPFKVFPLVVPKGGATQEDAAQKWVTAFIAKIATIEDADELNNFVGQKAAKLSELETARPDLHATLRAVTDDRFNQLQPSDTPLSDSEHPVEPHPATELCETIIAEINAAETIIDVNSIYARNNLDIMAMSDELAVKVEIAADKRKQELRGEKVA